MKPRPIVIVVELETDIPMSCIRTALKEEFDGFELENTYVRGFHVDLGRKDEIPIGYSPNHRNSDS